MVPAKARPASGSSRQHSTRPAPAPKPRPRTKPFRIPIVEISSPSSEAGMIDVRHDGVVRPDPNHQWTPEDLAMLKKVYPDANVEHTQRSDAFAQCGCWKPCIACDHCCRPTCRQCQFREWRSCVICAYEMMHVNSGQTTTTLPQFLHSEFMFEVQKFITANKK